MKAVHDSRRAEHRSPFGAVPVDGTVVLGLDVSEETPRSCTLRLWSDTRGERFLPMEKKTTAEGVRFETRLTLDEPELLWYHFVLEREDGATCFYGAREGRVGGEGELADHVPHAFQISVYEPRAVQPDWYRKGIVYQVFPDRFARGADWRERAEASLSERRGGPARSLVEDWDEPVRYERDERGHVTEWEFYGGTLQGIREKLGYLRDLGVTALYLNPIFEAASCHRYDTADFQRIDPMLGTEDDFRELCRDAGAMGISIILDGVFNHVGCDSRYFNRYGTYPEPGAWQRVGSPYDDWFTFREDGSYECWWGVTDLPGVREEAPGYRALIAGGEDSVVRHWLEAGARGWRLDVADELPEWFIRDIHDAAVAQREDALVLGEVWEDASNKISYGALRHYLLGGELDSAMNYPLRVALLDFLTNKADAPELAEALEALRENYPPDALYCALNLLGSHDRMRLLTLLGGAPEEDKLTDAERAAFRLNDGQRSLAKGRLWLAALVQMTMPGVPCVYYGDEAGMEGYADPYNRGTYPWGKEDADCGTIYRNAIGLRKSLSLFVDGGFSAFSCGKDVFGLVRTAAEGQDEASAAVVVVNRSFEERVAEMPVYPGTPVDVVSGRPVRVEGDVATITLPSLGSACVVWRPEKELGRPLEKGSGVICHITSLPSEDGQGTLGTPAKRFADVLARTGQRYWQVLPVNPTDQYGSPYAGVSAFAGNTRLVEGALPSHEDVRDLPEFREFVQREGSWLAPYAMFMAIKDLQGGIAWQTWPERYRSWDPALARDPELAEGVARHMAAQFAFDRQWRELRAYANERGVQIVGDIPMYVSADSADVWAHRDLFELGEDGTAQLVAGAPPDRFSEEGQVWGNPTYRWDVMRERGYDWWVARLRRSCELYDYVRLDHFLGFANYFSIPADGKAKDGHWRFGPGRALFERAHEELGDLPFVAEDLGVITPAVRTLLETCGFPGMDVVQFCDYDARKGYEPKPGRIAYASTHDTQTLVGFCTDAQAKDEQGKDEPGTDVVAKGEPGKSEPDEKGAAATARRMLLDMSGSSADVFICLLQDAMLLGDDARMNVPGVAAGNWSWQTTWDAIEAAEPLLRELAR